MTPSHLNERFNGLNSIDSRKFDIARKSFFLKIASRVTETEPFRKLIKCRKNFHGHWKNERKN